MRGISVSREFSSASIQYILNKNNSLFEEKARKPPVIRERNCKATKVVCVFACFGHSEKEGTLLKLLKRNNLTL